MRWCDRSQSGQVSHTCSKGNGNYQWNEEQEVCGKVQSYSKYIYAVLKLETFRQNRKYQDNVLSTVGLGYICRLETRKADSDTMGKP